MIAKITTLFALLLSMGLVQAQTFDGKTVAWPDQEAVVEFYELGTITHVIDNHFTVTNFTDSVRLRYAEVDTVLYAPWYHVNPVTKLRDGFYSIDGKYIGNDIPSEFLVGVYFHVDNSIITKLIKTYQ